MEDLNHQSHPLLPLLQHRIVPLLRHRLFLMTAAHPHSFQLLAPRRLAKVIESLRVRLHQSIKKKRVNTNVIKYKKNTYSRLR